jgi:hypothetical protein
MIGSLVRFVRYGSQQLTEIRHDQKRLLDNQTQCYFSRKTSTHVSVCQASNKRKLLPQSLRFGGHDLNRNLDSRESA